MLKNSQLILDIQEEPLWSTLKTKQQKFCLSVLAGHNVFLTGGAGFGKSWSLNFLFEFLDKKNIRFGKTSTTGISALNIGGSTLHSFTGIGLGDTDKNHLLKSVFCHKKAVERMRSAQILFIDEISMLSGGLLDKLEYIIKIVRRNSKVPFGGLQIVCSGDFHQLPPVNKDILNDSTNFVFESDAWKIANFKNIVLTESIRQKDDKAFTDLLNRLRVGDTSDIELLKTRINAPLKLPNGIKPVKLFGYNNAVERYNKQCLDEIKSKLYQFKAKDKGGAQHIEYFNKNCQAAQVLDLKLGAQVMLLKNLDQNRGLVNGSVGIVMSIEDNVPVVKFKNGESLLVEPDSWQIKEQVVSVDLLGKETIKYKVVAERLQIPLRLAFSYSIHKSQSATLDAVEIRLQECFETGMAYTALSRVRNLESLTVEPFDLSKTRVSKKVLDFYRNLKEND